MVTAAGQRGDRQQERENAASHGGLWFVGVMMPRKAMIRINIAEVAAGRA
jgi:hypothetical protein